MEGATILIVLAAKDEKLILWCFEDKISLRF